jgi:DNA-binding FadR family transcriptional regulator
VIEMGRNPVLKEPPSGADLGFSPIAPKRAFEEITEQIRQLLASGDLKPGDRLPAETDLVVRFSVSRNTLREALRALELAGIVELRKGASGGAYVRQGSSGVIVTGLRDLYHLGAITPDQLTEARIWLEGIVVRVACERATEQDLDALEANVTAAARAEKAGDFARRTELHRNFHLMLAATTGNPIVQIMMESVMEVLKQFVGAIGPAHNPFTIPSKRRLLRHLRARDAERAVAEMTRFLEKLHARYMERWSIEKLNERAVSR